ncbi:MAG: CcmD family protein [Myxococcota bacterium]
MPNAAPTTTTTTTSTPAAVPVPSSGEGATFERVASDAPEIASGEVLLVQAYAAFWILAMALVALSFRKQRNLDLRVRQLRDEVNEARVRGD